MRINIIEKKNSDKKNENKLNLLIEKKISELRETTLKRFNVPNPKEAQWQLWLAHAYLSIEIAYRTLFDNEEISSQFFETTKIVFFPRSFKNENSQKDSEYNFNIFVGKILLKIGIFTGNSHLFGNALHFLNDAMILEREYAPLKNKLADLPKFLAQTLCNQKEYLLALAYVEQARPFASTDQELPILNLYLRYKVSGSKSDDFKPVIYQIKSLPDKTRNLIFSQILNTIPESEREIFKTTVKKEIPELQHNKLPKIYYQQILYSSESSIHGYFSLLYTQIEKSLEYLRQGNELKALEFAMGAKKLDYLGDDFHSGVLQILKASRSQFTPIPQEDKRPEIESDQIISSSLENKYANFTRLIHLLKARLPKQDPEIHSLQQLCEILLANHYIPGAIQPRPKKEFSKQELMSAYLILADSYRALGVREAICVKYQKTGEHIQTSNHPFCVFDTTTETIQILKTKIKIDIGTKAHAVETIQNLTNPTTYYNQALIYCLTGELEKGIDDFDRFNAKLSHPYLFFLKAHLHKHNGDLEQAIESILFCMLFSQSNCLAIYNYFYHAFADNEKIILTDEVNTLFPGFELGQEKDFGSIEKALSVIEGTQLSPIIITNGKTELRTSDASKVLDLHRQQISDSLQLIETHTQIIESTFITVFSLITDGKYIEAIEKAKQLREIDWIGIVLYDKTYRLARSLQANIESTIKDTIPVAKTSEDSKQCKSEVKEIPKEITTDKTDKKLDESGLGQDKARKKEKKRRERLRLKEKERRQAEQRKITTKSVSKAKHKTSSSLQSSDALDGSHLDLQQTDDIEKSLSSFSRVHIKKTNTTTFRLDETLPQISNNFFPMCGTGKKIREIAKETKPKHESYKSIDAVTPLKPKITATTQTSISTITPTTTATVDRPTPIASVTKPTETLISLSENETELKDQENEIKSFEEFEKHSDLVIERIYQSAQGKVTDLDKDQLKMIKERISPKFIAQFNHCELGSSEFQKIKAGYFKLLSDQHILKNFQTLQAINYLSVAFPGLVKYFDKNPKFVLDMFLRGLSRIASMAPKLASTEVFANFSRWVLAFNTQWHIQSLLKSSGLKPDKINNFDAIPAHIVKLAIELACTSRDARMLSVPKELAADVYLLQYVKEIYNHRNHSILKILHSLQFKQPTGDLTNGHALFAPQSQTPPASVAPRDDKTTITNGAHTR